MACREEVIEDEKLSISTKDTADETLIDASEASADNPTTATGALEPDDTRLADTKAPREASPLDVKLEYLVGPANVAKVVSAAGWDVSGVPAAAGPRLVGTLMTWPTYRSEAATPGFAASRDGTGIPALWAMAKKVSPCCIVTVFVAREPRMMSGIRNSRRATGALRTSEGLRILR